MPGDNNSDVSLEDVGPLPVGGILSDYLKNVVVYRILAA